MAVVGSGSRWDVAVCACSTPPHPTPQQQRRTHQQSHPSGLKHGAERRAGVAAATATATVRGKVGGDDSRQPQESQPSWRGGESPQPGRALAQALAQWLFSQAPGMGRRARAPTRGGTGRAITATQAARQTPRRGCRRRRRRPDHHAREVGQWGGGGQ